MSLLKNGTEKISFTGINYNVKYTFELFQFEMIFYNVTVKHKKLLLKTFFTFGILLTPSL